MGWQTDWQAISLRITSLIETASFLFHTGEGVGADHYGVSSDLIRNARTLYQEICIFGELYGSLLPPGAKEALDKFIANRKHLFTNSHLGGWSGLQALAPLGSFRSEFSYCISDTEVVARNLIERAFLHLQRSIIVDSGIKTSWQNAFTDGETACERLGSVHLLLFGIWAFKAVAVGERTDLILGNKLQITPSVQNASEAMALTEWKLIRSESEVPAKSDQALAQARLYGNGSLAGFELRSCRYLVLVSENYISNMPPDVIEDDILYQFRNIAVSPPSPSKASLS